MKMRRSKAFTLLELLVVMAVIALLAALLLPALSRAKETVRRTACLNNLKQVNLAIHLYADDYLDPKAVKSFVDGHAGFVKIYWDGRSDSSPCNYEPPARYDYNWDGE